MVAVRKRWGGSSSRPSRTSDEEKKDSLAKGAYSRLFLAVALACAPLAFLAVAREYGFILRKPKRLWRPRQVLVVGTMASGTGQMSKDLNDLGLEVGHETSTTADGTISWVHALRLFSDHHGPDLSVLCVRPTFGMAWHPMLIEPGLCAGMVNAGGWNDCWARQCVATLPLQYGCDYRKRRGANGSTTCLPTFRRILLQVRHPLRTLASCVRGFCPQGNATASASVTNMLRTVRALLPSLPWDDHPTCLGQFALFWLTYQQHMRPLVDAWYRLEDSTACDVARLAGFWESEEGDPHWATAKAACAARTALPPAGGGRAVEHVNRHNLDGYSLTYEALAEVVGRDLRDAIQQAAVSFGYAE